VFSLRTLLTILSLFIDECTQVSLKGVYPVPATGTRSPRIANRQSAVNNSLAPKPTPKPNPSPNSNP